MRSDFLTTLCILTFLGCAWGLIDNVTTIFRSEAVTEIRRDELAQRGNIPPEAAPSSSLYDGEGGGYGPGDPDFVRKLAFGQLGYSLLTLIGAILMFNLRRVGWFVYVTGVVIGLVAPVALVGFTALNATFGVFFSMIFAALYWLQLKEMR